jgi:hypothetical protein
MPLRPILYNSLRAKRKYGNIIITHEGESMISSYDYDVIARKFRLNIREPGEYYRANCPFCNDTRRRLWINHRWGLFDEKVGSYNLWLCCCYNEGCLETYERQRSLFNELLDPTNDRAIDTVDIGTNPLALPREAEMPGGVIDLEQLHKVDPLHPALTYLRGRGYDPIWLSRAFKVSVCVDPKPQFQSAFGRIIMPIFMNDKLVGWQGRYVGEERDKRIPKYYSMPGMKKTQILYNLDAAKTMNLIVVVEGPTDVWSFGPEAVALFGKTVSTLQLQQLVGAHKPIVVMLDSDAMLEAEGVYQELGSTPKMMVILPEGRDPGSYSTPELRQLVGERCKEAGFQLQDLNV